MILPHTDLEGSYAIAERLRVAIESLQVPLLGGLGELHITATVGVSTCTDGDKNALIAEADGPRYAAKRSGKNRTIRAQPQTANVVGAE